VKYFTARINLKFIALEYRISWSSLSAWSNIRMF